MQVGRPLSIDTHSLAGGGRGGKVSFPFPEPAGFVDFFPLLKPDKNAKRARLEVYVLDLAYQAWRINVNVLASFRLERSTSRTPENFCAAVGDAKVLHGVIAGWAWHTYLLFLHGIRMLLLQGFPAFQHHGPERGIAHVLMGERCDDVGHGMLQPRDHFGGFVHKASLVLRNMISEPVNDVAVHGLFLLAHSTNATPVS